jgi:glycosyltransferase involved in cell wall biosynthesis
MNSKCSCIIPIYNEAQRISEVLKIFSQVKEIDEIICVDDGSTDDTNNVIKTLFPKVKLLTLSTNQGKSVAIATGLNETENEFIFLADADILNIKASEIRCAVIAMKTNPVLDMIILRRNKTVLSIKLTRADVVFSGEKILKRKDLLRVFTLKPQLYQIEVAINEYMIRHRKRVYWISSSAQNIFKTEKFGLLPGIWGELVMHKSMIDYIGLFSYVRQRLFFCHKRLPHFPL